MVVVNILPNILKQFLSGYFLHGSLLQLLLQQGDFSTDISQGSVATYLRFRFSLFLRGCQGSEVIASLNPLAASISFISWLRII